jgi:hypothetical protein
LLLSELLQLQVLLPGHLVDKDQSGFLARSHPAGNVRDTHLVGLKRVTPRSEKLNACFVTAVVVNDTHQAPIKDLLRPTKRAD